MTDSTDLPRLDRRRLLHGAAVLGVAAPVLVACGSDEEPTRTTTTPESDSPSVGSDKPTQDGGGQPALAASGDVPVGGGVVVDGEQVVVTQPTEGEFKAFTAVCTHQGCVVSSISDNTINCACHGSQFSAEDGSVVTGPATSPLTEIAVKVEGDSVVRS
jgi:Rieske Fe-S protein